MNKIVFTNDRLFMALVGPGCPCKTRLIYSMLTSPSTFCSPIEKKTFYVYKVFQPLFQEMSERLNIEFIPCLDFEMIRNFEIYLLVFDDSCEETCVYQTCSRRYTQETTLHFRQTSYSIKASGRVRLI